MATPSGLDRDYNYLKGVERQIDYATQDVDERGIGVKSVTSKNVLRGWRNDSALQRYLAQNNITIEHAPKGMSRQKSNQTRPTKSNRIVWTVEWVRPSGTVLQHDCTESDSVSSLYERLLEESLPSERKQRGSKRKRAEAASHAEEAQSTSATTNEDQHARSDAPQKDESTVDLKEPSAAKDSSEKLSAETATAADQPADPVPETADVASETDAGPSHFYLLKTGASSASRVLIPLAPEATLTACLRHQTVQEFPTLVVLPNAPGALPEGFVLLVDHLKRQRGEDDELQRLIGQTESRFNKAQASRGPQQQAAEQEELDAESILDMLKRDVR